MAQYTNNHNPLESISEASRIMDLCVQSLEQDFITIPTTRYEELICAEAELDVILRAHQNCDDFRLKDVLVAVFGPNCKEEIGNA